MTEIEYIKSRCNPYLKVRENIIITHICNDIGGWGKGFVLALSKRWKAPEEQYRKWYQEKDGFSLGAVQFVQVEDLIWVANIIGQHKIRKDEKGLPPIRYEAVREALTKVAILPKKNKLMYRCLV